MTDLTPDQEALYALGWNLPRADLPPAAQLEYDRLKPAWDQNAPRRGGLAHRQKVNRSGMVHTFRVMPFFHMVTGIVAVLFGVGGLVGEAAALAYPSSSWALGDGGVSASDDFWWAVLSLSFMWVGIRLLRVGVQVSAGKMTNRGYFWTRSVDASDIRAITLQPKDDGNGDRWMPRVELTGGKGFWIRGFDCGPARKPPIPDRAATLDEVRALLELTADDIGQPETRQGA